MGSVSNEKKVGRLTLDQLIAARDQKERDKLRVEEIEIPSIGGTLLFKRPSDELILEMVNRLKDSGEDTKRYYDELANIIYECCDDLKSQELYDRLEVGNPIDVVYEIMDLNDIAVVGDKVCSMNSIFDGVEDQIKNA